MNYCDNCGEGSADTARFCRNCGLPLSTNTITSSQSLNRNQNLSHIAFPSSEHQPDIVIRNITNINTKTTQLSQQSADAISHTIFVVSAGFAAEMQDIFNSLRVNCAGIVYDSDPTLVIRKCHDKIRKCPDGTIRYVCIVGNWDEIPPTEIQNTMLDDGDAVCFTDALYGSTDEFNYDDPFTAIPVLPVGRIPVANRDVVYRMLTQSPALSPKDNAFLFGVTADCWSDATLDIISTFPNLPHDVPQFLEPLTKDFIPRSTVLCSPAWDEDTLRETIGGEIRSQYQVILFNVHGGIDDPVWVGEGHRHQYVHIFSPGTIKQYNSSIIVSEACYGGAIDYDGISIVEHFFLNGGSSFVGSSTIAYGSPSPPICGADLIAKHYIKGLYALLSG